MIERQFAEDRNKVRLAASLVGYALNMSTETLMAKPRGTLRVAHARQIAMYLSHIGFGLSLARVALAFGRDRSTVAYACQAVEDKRDEAAFDVWIEQLADGLVSIEPLARAA